MWATTQLHQLGMLVQTQSALNIVTALDIVYSAVGWGN